MKTLLNRLKSPTPAFWTKIQKISGGFAAVGTFILATPLSYPELLTTLAPYLVTVGLVSVFLAQLTTKDNQIQTPPIPPQLRDPLA